MRAFLSAAGAGIVFGIGIGISGMANPAKVINFFDLAGTWDPSLIFVMGGALVTAMIGYRLVFGAMAKPAFETRFNLPDTAVIDSRLIGGSALFGIGWGIAGFCPGGAIPALGIAPGPTAIFIISLLAGVIAARWLINRVPRLAPA